MFTITIIPLIHNIHIQFDTPPQFPTPDCCFWFLFFWSVWFCRSIEIIILNASGKYNLTFLSHRSFFHTILIVDNVHGVQSFLNDAQWKYLRPHRLDNPLNIPHGHIALQLVGPKKYFICRTGGMISDGFSLFSSEMENSTSSTEAGLKFATRTGIMV